MSVDFLVCRNCGETFCDCGEYISCECGEHWCCDECAEDDGFEKEHCKLDKDIYDQYPEEDCDLSNKDNGCFGCKNYIQESCNYCRNEDYDDSVLLDVAMKLLDCDREYLIKSVKDIKK